MQTVSIHEAKIHLSRLLELVAGGEEIIIAKAGKAVTVWSRRRPPDFQYPPALESGG